MYNFTAAFNYQYQTPPESIGGVCSPNLVQTHNYLHWVYGGQPLGCYGERPIRGGTVPSTHWTGSAFDWRYENVGGGYREVGRDKAVEIIDWLIENALVLGIQCIHDYFGCKIWKIERGWKTQTKSSTGMGQKWALWIHVETHPDAWADSTPPLEREGLTPSPPVGNTEPNPGLPELPPIIPSTPENPVSTEPTQFNPVTVPSLGTVKKGHTGLEVKKLQALLFHVWTQTDVVIDGQFGQKTEDGLKAVQMWTKITADGVCGPQSWKTVLDA